LELNKQIIRGKAPLRISFAGGGTDLEPYSSEQGGVTLSTTIDKYAFGTLIPRSDDSIIIESMDFGQSVNYNTKDYLPLDGSLDLLKAVVNRLAPGKGFSLMIECDAPSGTGMGSSGTIAVLVIGLLLEYLGKHMGPYEIAEMAYEIEKNDIGIVVGRQDQYAATFGGFNFIEYLKDMTLVTPLRLRSETINELESNLVLCFMHQGRTSEDPVNIEVDQYQKDKDSVIKMFLEYKDLTYRMKNKLLLSDLNSFIELFRIAGESKINRSLLGGSEKIQSFIKCAYKHKARALKTLGAAGGGHLLVMCDVFNRKNLIAAMENQGGTVIPLHFSQEGMVCWRTSYNQLKV